MKFSKYWGNDFDSKTSRAKLLRGIRPGLLFTFGVYFVGTTLYVDLSGDKEHRRCVDNDPILRHAAKLIDASREHYFNWLDLAEK